MCCWCCLAVRALLEGGREGGEACFFFFPTFNHAHIKYRSNGGIVKCSVRNSDSGSVFHVGEVLQLGGAGELGMGGWGGGWGTLSLCVLVSIF